MTRYLRIAGAGFFVLLTVGFVALWDRSYDHLDTINSPGSRFALSHRGRIVQVRIIADISDLGVILDSPYSALEASTVLGFGMSRHGVYRAISVPYWFLAACSFALAALFAFKRSWRFTTRGLLISTSLLAIALGLGVYFL